MRQPVAPECASNRVPLPGLRRRVAVGAAAAVALAVCAPSTMAACSRVPRSIPRDQLLTGHTTLRVRPGRTVYVVLVESENLLQPGFPTVFPWQRPSSSNPNVLAPVRVCKSHSPSSLPLTTTAFRALKPGKATVAAAIAPQWRSRANKPRPSVDHVIVT